MLFLPDKAVNYFEQLRAGQCRVRRRISFHHVACRQYKGIVGLWVFSFNSDLFVCYCQYSYCCLGISLQFTHHSEFDKNGVNEYSSRNGIKNEWSSVLVADNRSTLREIIQNDKKLKGMIFFNFLNCGRAPFQVFRALRNRRSPTSTREILGHISYIFNVLYYHSYTYKDRSYRS